MVGALARTVCRAAAAVPSFAAGAAALLLTLPPALAASEGHGEGHGAASGGMPQLDPASFPSQIFWLLVTFLILYVVMAKVALPRVNEILEDRERRITGDLDRATQLRDEALSIGQRIDRDLSGSRGEAQEILRGAGNDIAKEHATKIGEAAGLAAKTVAAAEARIAAARDAALASVRGVAVDVVKATSTRIAGLEVTDQMAGEMVDLVMREQG